MTSHLRQANRGTFHAIDTSMRPIRDPGDPRPVGARLRPGDPAARHRAGRKALGEGRPEYRDPGAARGVARHRTGTAEDIVKARPFKSVDDLKTVKGISSKVFAEVADHVQVATAPAPKPEKVTTATGPKLDLNTATRAA